MPPFPLPVIVAAALLASPLAPQDTSDVGRGAARNAITLDLLGLSRGIYAGEYARTVGGPLSLGVGVRYYGARWNEAHANANGDHRQLVTELRLRGYSEHTSFRGAALVLHAGAFSERDMRHHDTPEGTTVEAAWRHYPTFALSAEQAWSRGRRREPVLILGAGYRTIIARGGFLGGALEFNASLGGLF